MYTPFSLLLWDLAQSQGCFWRWSPRFCSLKGSFISHRGSFPPRPSLSFAFQLSVWGSQTDPSKPSLFPWSICPSLPPSAFLFLEGAPSCLCVQMTCVITSTPVNEFTPLQLSRDVQQHRLVSTVTRGYLGSSLPLPMPRGQLGVARLCILTRADGDRRSQHC